MLYFCQREKESNFFFHVLKTTTTDDDEYVLFRKWKMSNNIKAAISSQLNFIKSLSCYFLIPKQLVVIVNIIYRYVHTCLCLALGELIQNSLNFILMLCIFSRLILCFYRRIEIQNLCCLLHRKINSSFNNAVKKNENWFQLKILHLKMSVHVIWELNECKS